MKKSGKTLVSVLLALAICSGVALLCGILLLPASISGPDTLAGEHISGVGYYDFPKSRGLFFIDGRGGGAFVFLDFENITTSVYLFPEKATLEVLKLPFTTDFTFHITDVFLGRFCDRLGGIEMEGENGGKRLYFSAALAEFCGQNPDTDKMQKISSAFFEKISKTGLSSEDFMFIIEETKSDLSYTVCYDWIGRLEEMLLNCVFY